MRPHDPKNVERLLHNQMQGVWRTLVIQSHGQSVKTGINNSPVIVMFRGHGLMLNPGGVSTDNKIISIDTEKLVVEMRPEGKSKTVNSLYRWLPSGRLELAMNDSGKQPKSFESADTVFRISKIETAREGADLEKEALKMFSDANETASKLEFVILENETKKPIGLPVITSADLVSVSADYDENTHRRSILFETTYEASERLRRATKAHIGKAMQVRVDGKEITSPIIQSAISGTGTIEAGFTEEEAEKLAEEIVPGLKGLSQKDFKTLE